MNLNEKKKLVENIAYREKILKKIDREIRNRLFNNVDFAKDFINFIVIFIMISAFVMIPALIKSYSAQITK